MNFIDAMNFRHACKLFDTSKKVSASDQAMIIEYGRLSPSSFGFEPWHFLVISDAALRKQLQPHCWNQPQITSASCIVVYLSYQPYHFRANHPFFRQRVWRRSQNNEENFARISDRVINYLSEHNTGEWAKRQTYIALANMMTGAASLGIDSCPIEGFDTEGLKAALKDYVDWAVFDTVAVAAFGYRAGEQSPRIREATASIATVI